ncbi:MAG: AAA family ATPase [Deltaproteobacteria bacterium]|nr:AAA family ATPase [Deltaproteobacteria bacterium]
MTRESADFTAVALALLRRKRLLLISGLAGASLAFAVSRVLPVEYSSEGSVIIENRSSPSDLLPDGPSILTEADVLQSKGLIRHAVEDFKLADAPSLIPTPRLPVSVRERLSELRDKLARLWHSVNSNWSHSSSNETKADRVARYIQSKLTVTVKDKSRVISLRFEAGTPAAAAAVVNAIMSTYLASVEAARDAEISRADQWVARQITIQRQEVAAAEQHVTEFVQAHNLPEVQGSLAAAVQLSRDQDQLALARADLARQQAAFETAAHGSAIEGAQEMLESRPIQTLKEYEAKVVGQINLLPPSDPRRSSLQAELKSVQAQIERESSLVLASLSRAAEIARRRVRALEATVQKESEQAQDSTVADATLKHLTNDLEAKRQVYSSFLTQAGQMRIAVAQAPSAHLLFQALPPHEPAHSFGMLSALLGFICGVAGTAGISILRERMRTTINSIQEVTVATGLPVFGALPDVKQLRGGSIALPSQARSLITETFRALWVAIRSQQEQGTAVVVTSSEADEGKTTVALALAHRFADDGFRVLLIDADLRRRRLSAALDQQAVCLESVLDGSVALEHAVLPVKTGLHCLLSNGSAKNPVRTLSSDKLEQVLAAARASYDFVILDSPPVMHVADPVLIGKLCQHIIFIVQAGRVSNELVGEAIRRFPEEERPKILALLTRVPRKQLDNRGYYSGYARVARIAGAQQ